MAKSAKNSQAKNGVSDFVMVTDIRGNQGQPDKARTNARRSKPVE